jgi:hypothetical protein
MTSCIALTIIRPHNIGFGWKAVHFGWTASRGNDDYIAGNENGPVD